MNADIALLGGKVWTGRSSSPEAQALAIQGDRILAVGSTEEVSRLCGPSTRRMWLRGRLVVPGFHDSHLHFATGCLRLSEVYLKDAPDEAEFGRRLREFDERLPPDRWVTGGLWDHDLTFGGALPTARTVDRHVPNRPVLLRRYDGHMALANSLALKMAGLTKDTPDPPGGRIVRDPRTGQPTGVLQDNATEPVQKLIPPPEADDVAHAMPTGLQEAARLGITSVHDMLGDPGLSVETYGRLATRGDLTVRAHLYWPIGTWQEARAAAPELTTYADRLRLCGVKGFVDGSLGSSTAWFCEPYLHEPGNSGLAVVDLDQLREAMRTADAQGSQLAVHAIGDRATSELLGLWEQIAADNGPRDRRLRMEHAQHIRTEDFARFAALDAIASMQPYHAIDDGRWAEERIGAERCRHAYAFRQLLDSGVRLSFGSDWPVAPISPLAGIDAAVNRRTVDGRHPNGWHPHQRITVPEALRAYTSDAAYAVFREQDLGALEPGKLADAAVLSLDITDPANREAIPEAEVILTILGGRVVHDAME